MDIDTSQRLNEAAVRASTAIRQGDLLAAQAAFKHLHDILFWRVNRFIRARIRPARDPDFEAEDLACEAFLALWRQMGDFDPLRGSIRGLLYTIAARLAGRRSRENYQRLRRETTPRADADDTGNELEDLPATATDSEADAIHQAEESWRLDNLARLMQNLLEDAPDSHQLLLLRYQEGLNCARIAEVLGISHAAARQRDVSARLALFQAGWRLIREDAPQGTQRLKWYRPQSTRELAEIADRDPNVPELFSEYFGATSWHLVKPRRGAGASK